MRPNPPAAGRAPERLALDIALYLGLIGVFAWAALALLWPFAGLILWTLVIAAALRPAWIGLSAALGGRERLAAFLVTAGALLVLIGPIAMLATSLVASAEWIAGRLHAGGIELPDPPAFLTGLPAVGPEIAQNWQLASTNLEALLTRYGHTLLGAGEAAARPALHLFEGAAIFLAAVALSGFLHRPGAALAAAARQGVGKVLGPRSGGFVDIAGATVRTVARGVIGVAAIQALLVGVGLIVAGVPAAGLLTLAALVLAIIQAGVWPVVVPVAAWAFFTRDMGSAALLSGWLFFAAILDVPLKPLMLGRGIETPRLVIFAGVIGGTIAYGLIGLFVGPVLLALAYQVVRFGLYGEAGASAPTGAAPPPTDGRGGIE